MITDQDGEPARHELTSQQARVWASGALLGGLTQHVYACDLPAGISSAAIATAASALADRHSALRTRIGRDDTRLYQCADGPAPTIESRDVRAPADEAVQRLCEPGTTLVNVADGPSARFIVIRADGGDRRLVVALHSAITDGWSRMIILAELDRLVTGDGAELPDLRPVHSLGYLGDKERRWRSTAEYGRRLRFWNGMLAESRPDPVQPPDPPGARTGSHRGEPVGTATAEAVANLCRAARVGPAAGYLAALTCAFAQITGAATVPVCLLTSGRDAEIGTSVGVFANHVPMPVSARVAARLAPGEIWQLMTRVLRHEVPLPGLVEAHGQLRSRIAGTTSRGVGFQMAPAWPAFGSLRFRPVVRAAVPFAPLEISVRQDRDCVRLDALNDPSRCGDDLARRLLAAMAARLAELCGLPETVTHDRSAIPRQAISTAGCGKDPR